MSDENHLPADDDQHDDRPNHEPETEARVTHSQNVIADAGGDDWGGGGSNGDRRGDTRGILAIPRRQIATIALSLLGLSGAASLTSDSARAEASIDFTAADTAVENNDGEITSVSIEPTVDIEWENFSDGLERIDLTIDAAVGESTDSIYDESVESDRIGDEVELSGDSFDLVQGVIQADFDQVDITDRGTDIDESTFDNGGVDSGDTETTTVSLLVSITLVGAATEEVSLESESTFDVDVSNPDADATATGSANTDSE
ncbi:hypothetical protein [Halalkalirubrum salinum]|uniref:hypothetical protein n=1 Tax=Halalkalirubrum salinum TaxID=2563889 RepID=UPI0010FB3D67|nr:hypothetical protein [Halalkalirubrum salinum]